MFIIGCTYANPRRFRRQNDRMHVTRYTFCRKGNAILMATIKEIAELSGVSRGTVDRVLNHRGVVNEKTAEKVLEIAQLLDYQPNKAGIALAAQKKKIKIGVLLFGAENPFFDEVMEGLLHKLDELSIYGCTLEERRISFDVGLQLSAIDELVAAGIHGLILSPCNDAAVREKVDALSQSGIPCVTINTDLPDSKRIAYIGSDYYKCGRVAGGLFSLLTGEHAEIGIITGSHNVLCHEERIRGLRDYIEDGHPGLHITAVTVNDDDDNTSYAAVTALLAAYPALSALYFTAAGVHGGCRAVLDAGLPSLPKIVTFDAVPTTREMLTNGVISATICQQPAEQGAKSLSLLVDYLLTGEVPAQPQVLTDLNIQIRESL